MPRMAAGVYMSKIDKYFQFPLSCLAYAKTTERRIFDIIGWCVLDAGEKGLERLEAEGQEGMIEGILINSNIKMDCDNHMHKAAAIGLSTLSVTAECAEDMVVQHKRTSCFIQDMENQFGPSPFVRIKTNFLWQAVQDVRTPGTGMSWRTFSVLCAVYAILGDKAYARICRDRIKAAALGYKSKDVMKNHIDIRQDKTKPLTDSQLKTTLTMLEADGFFCRVHPSPRKTFFSNRMTRKDLSKAVLVKETGRHVRIAQNRREDKILQADIRRLKGVRSSTMTAPYDHQIPRHEIATII